MQSNGGLRVMSPNQPLQASNTPHSAQSSPTGTSETPGVPPSSSKSRLIREVWAANLEEEFRIIRELVVDYPYIAMDTEFPGVVATPVGTYKSPTEYYYHMVRTNVNLLRVIQIGITLMNERGEVPEQYCTWQFNFRFSLGGDTYAKDSIELLANSGINFDHLFLYGIDGPVFADLLMSSGLVLMPDVHWIVFHGAYDFGYLLRLLTQRELPDRDEDFLTSFHNMFPAVYDIKYILRETDIMHSAGLDYLADSLSIRRVGATHQAGSDSLLTGHCFFKLVRDRLGHRMPERAKGILYGLGEDTAAATPATGTTASSVSGIVTAGGGGNARTSFPAAPSSTAAKNTTTATAAAPATAAASSSSGGGGINVVSAIAAGSSQAAAATVAEPSSAKPTGTGSIALRDGKLVILK